jgi:hypothetical protein
MPNNFHVSDFDSNQMLHLLLVCPGSQEHNLYGRIYRDNSLVIMNGIKYNIEIREWLSSFQKEANLITSYDGLVFTVSIWREKTKDKCQSKPPKSRGREELSCSVP